MLTQFFFTLGTGQGLIGLRGPTLRMEAIGDLPLGQKHQRHEYQTPGVDGGDEDQGRAHHGKIPVVNAAGTTTAVAHHPGLEGADPQDADHIAHTVSQADQDQNALINDACIVQKSDDTI